MRPSLIPSIGWAWLSRRVARAGSAVCLALLACAPQTQHTPPHAPHFLVVRAACTAAARARGLHGDPSPPPGTAQLFVFERHARHGVTMRGMSYDLDIAWIDGNGAVLRVDRRVSHAPTLGVSEVRIALSRYALELAAGDAARQGLHPGAHVRHLTSVCAADKGAFHVVVVD